MNVLISNFEIENCVKLLLLLRKKIKIIYFAVPQKKAIGNVYQTPYQVFWWTLVWLWCFPKIHFETAEGEFAPLGAPVPDGK